MALHTFLSSLHLCESPPLQLGIRTVRKRSVSVHLALHFGSMSRTVSTLKANALDEPTAVLVGTAVFTFRRRFFCSELNKCCTPSPFRLCPLQACSLARGRHVVRALPIRRITAIGRVSKSRWRSVAGHRSPKGYASEQIDVVPLT